MNELQFYNILIIIFIGIAVIIFISLFFITAPYGRHEKSGWGPMINNKLGWIIMESPASILFALYFFLGNRFSTPFIIFLLIWQSHYFHRAFIYPFQLQGNKKMPVSIIMSGLFFNLINTYIQGRWLFTFSPEAVYNINWLFDPRFIIGIFTFYTGYAINKHSDAILHNLRTPGETGYKIPTGGMYRFVSSPNYFGEIIEWIGWAIMTWSLAGLVFALWTCANLVPRAYSHHQWYMKNFHDYPENRKVIIPFIF